MKKISITRIVVLLLLINAIKIPPEEVPVIEVSPEYLQAAALATPWFIIDTTGSDEVIAHERVHIKQMNEYGSVWFFIINGYYLHKYGYHGNPFEIEAYKTGG